MTSLTNIVRNALPIVYHPLYSAPKLAQNHRFPMAVFERIAARILHEGIARSEDYHCPTHFPSREQLLTVHSKQYVDHFLSGTLDEHQKRRIGFGNVTSERLLIDRTLAEVAGTLLTAELALEHGLACNTAGGTHHAFPSFGSGFCILNDLAITADLLVKQEKAQRVLILDLDVHQGDGTAACFQGRKDVFTLSVHAESNFPAKKQKSHMDVGLRDGTGDDEYLSRVAEILPGILQEFKPDLVLYDAGVDIHVGDDLGRLSISDEGLERREYLVLDTCLACGTPVAGFVGGGYAEDLDVLADRHITLHRVASELWRQYC